MASLFGHGVLAVALGAGFSKPLRNVRFIVLGVVCAILPDADVISFSFGIPYHHLWGHRGMTHSLIFALLLGLVVTAIFYHNSFKSKKWLAYTAYFFLCTVSHGVLDAMTTGGLGVAFFAPFDQSRYFLPWRPIQVSPIGWQNFIGAWGIRVLKSEALFIGLPSLVFWIIAKGLRKTNTN